ncbi:FtsJ-like methyltransferase family protein [Abeliophyllum distichum]|uniref:FtsJ-like methyltransferase family protein n=1 Tax=Abeliophyllum distichum TaxID=126358 RepID=A0ABD1NN97_9LAMI
MMIDIVPAPVTDSDSSSSDDSDEDDDIDSTVEILACRKKMLMKKHREHILDEIYDKYMFHDEELHKWFMDEEKRHYQPIKSMSIEEIAALRKRFKENDAMPAKKVAEAKARKKLAAHRQLEKVRKKENSISDQTDISDRSKRKMIEQLYKKATPKMCK